MNIVVGCDNRRVPFCREVRLAIDKVWLRHVNSGQSRDRPFGHSLLSLFCLFLHGFRSPIEWFARVSLEMVDVCFQSVCTLQMFQGWFGCFIRAGFKGRLPVVFFCWRCQKLLARWFARGWANLTNELFKEADLALDFRLQLRLSRLQWFEPS